MSQTHEFVCKFCGKFNVSDKHINLHFKDSNTSVAFFIDNQYLIALIPDYSSYSLYGKFVMLKRFIENEIPSYKLFKKCKAGNYSTFVKHIKKMRAIYYDLLFDDFFTSPYDEQRTLIFRNKGRDFLNSDLLHDTIGQMGKCIHPSFEKLFNRLLLPLILYFQDDPPKEEIKGVLEIEKESKESKQDVILETSSNEYQKVDEIHCIEEANKSSTLIENDHPSIGVNKNSGIDIGNPHSEKECSIS